MAFSLSLTGSNGLLKKHNYSTQAEAVVESGSSSVDLGQHVRLAGLVKSLKLRPDRTELTKESIAVERLTYVNLF